MATSVRRVSALVLAPLMVAAAACGDDSGGDLEASEPEGFKASRAYLSQVIEESTSEPFRFEAAMTWGFDSDGDFEGIRDVPAMSGHSDGSRTYMSMDIGRVAEEMAAADDEDLPYDPDEVDLAIETVTDGDTVYIHAPGWAEVEDVLPQRQERAPLVEVVAELGESWGRLQLSELGDDVEAQQLFSQLNGGQNLDPAFYLELVQETEEVGSLGSRTFGSESLFGLAGEVSLSAMLEAQGIDPSTLATDAPADELARVMDAFRVPICLWLDDAGTIRRLTMDVGEGMAAAAQELDEPIGPMAGFVLGVAITFTDHGDDSITVDVPDAADTVDLTETVRDL